MYVASIVCWNALPLFMQDTIMYILTHTYTHMRTHTHTCTHIHTRVRTCVHTCTCMCVHTYIFMYVCMYLCVYVCVRMCDIHMLYMYILVCVQVVLGRMYIFHIQRFYCWNKRMFEWFVLLGLLMKSSLEN